MICSASHRGEIGINSEGDGFLKKNLLMGKIIIVFAIICIFFSILGGYRSNQWKRDYNDRVINEPGYSGSQEAQNDRAYIEESELITGFCGLNAISFFIIGGLLYKFNKREQELDDEKVIIKRKPIKSDIEYQCYSCDSPVEEEWKFCPNCGADFED